MSGLQRCKHAWLAVRELAVRELENSIIRRDIPILVKELTVPAAPPATTAAVAAVSGSPSRRCSAIRSAHVGIRNAACLGTALRKAPAYRPAIPR